MKRGRLTVRLREIQRDLYTFYTRVYCEFIVIVGTSVQRREHSLHMAPSDRIE